MPNEFLSARVSCLIEQEHPRDKGMDLNSEKINEEAEKGFIKSGEYI